MSCQISHIWMLQHTEYQLSFSPPPFRIIFLRFEHIYLYFSVDCLLLYYKVISLTCQVNVYYLLKLDYHLYIPKAEGRDMATSKKVFTLRLSDEVFDKIGILATSEHRSLTNYIEYVLIQHLEEVEKERGIIITDQTKN